MKRIKTELEVDFIGGVGSLTKEEEQLISKFLKAKKQKKVDKKHNASHQNRSRAAASIVYVQR